MPPSAGRSSVAALIIKTDAISLQRKISDEGAISPLVIAKAVDKYEHGARIVRQPKLIIELHIVGGGQVL